MAKKSSKTPRRTSPSKTHGVINGAGEIVEQPIVSTIRENYMPYAMSVIPVQFPKSTGSSRRTESSCI